jgi:AcrR family transcriptional regulator
MPGGGRESLSRREERARDTARSASAQASRAAVPPKGSRAVAPAQGPRAVAPAQRARAIDPIYKRLPHGPHRLDRDEVVRHQRARIYGAMVEAIALAGYERTSVRQVIGLAGVSRRSFYEQFANKQECFLATFDLLATRGIRCLAQGYLAADGDFSGRLDAGLRALCAKVEQVPRAAALVLVDAQTAGGAGTLRVHRSVTSCERLLARAFTSSSEVICPPAPIVRALTGGMHGALAHTVRAEARNGGAADVAEQMLAWLLPFGMHSAEHAELLAGRLRARMRQISLASAHHVGEETPSHGEERERILHEALRLASLYDYRELSAPQIADEARVPIDSFLEAFATREECYLAALEMVGEQLLEMLTNAELADADWPSAARRKITRLLCLLGEQPLYARTIAQSAFAAGGAPAARTLELLDAIVAELSAGAPQADGLAAQALSGALLHTIRTQVVDGRTQLLGALCDHFSYVVIASFLGVDAAHEALLGPAPCAL